MLKRLSLAALLLALASACSAEELLFAGQVQKLTLQPSGVGDCPPKCPASKGPDENGTQTVCVSNMRECQIAEVKVVTDYLGSSDTVNHTFKSRTGEWGHLNFPIRADLILVHAMDGKATWAPLTTRDGKTYVKAAAMTQVGRVPVRSLEQDADGQVLLDVLIERVRSGK